MRAILHAKFDAHVAKLSGERAAGAPGATAAWGPGSWRRSTAPSRTRPGRRLERSLSLAASMEPAATGAVVDCPKQRRTTGALLVGGLLGLVVGIYALLDYTVPRFLVWPMLVLGVVLSTGGFVAAGRRVRRTRYRPDPWRLAELVTATTGCAR